jgi:hypothetical protein
MLCDLDRLMLNEASRLQPPEISFLDGSVDWLYLARCLGPEVIGISYAQLYKKLYGDPCDGIWAEVGQRDNCIQERMYRRDQLID